jgi:hypothetical protein
MSNPMEYAASSILKKDSLTALVVLTTMSMSSA